MPQSSSNTKNPKTRLWSIPRIFLSSKFGWRITTTSHPMTVSTISGGGEDIQGTPKSLQHQTIDNIISPAPPRTVPKGKEVAGEAFRLSELANRPSTQGSTCVDGLPPQPQLEGIPLLNRLNPDPYSLPKSIPQLRNKLETFHFPFADQCIGDAHRERFRNVQECLKENFEQDSKLCRGQIAYALSMTGHSRDGSDAAPTILIFGPDNDSNTIKRIREIVGKLHVKEQYVADFRIICLGASHVLLGNIGDDVDIFYTDDVSLCGCPVVAHGNNEQLCTVACILVIQSRLYALTSGHPFALSFESVKEHEKQSSKERKAEERGEDGQVSHGSCDQADSGAQVESPSVGKIYLRQHIYPLVIHSCNIRRVTPDDTWSGNYPNLDWALAELDASRNWTPNHCHNAIGSRDMARNFDISPSPRIPNSAESIRLVLVAISPDRCIAGYIRSVPTFVSNWDNTAHSLEVWTVTMPLGRFAFRPGHSGSLVIDYETHQPYGHVIAINPLGDLYVVPLYAALQQIKDVLGTSDVALLSKPWKGRKPGVSSEEPESVMEGNSSSLDLGDGTNNPVPRKQSSWNLLGRLLPRPQPNELPKAYHVGPLVNEIKDGSGVTIYFWEVADYSLQQIWEALRPLIAEHLNSLEDSSNAGALLTVEFYMVGYTASTAAPKILFYSMDASVRQWARDATKKSGILKDYPYIGTGTMYFNLEPLATDNIESIFPSYSNSIFEREVLTHPADNSFGCRMFIKSPSGTSLRPATGGPILWINEKAFQLTVGHAFRETAEVLPTQEQSLNSATWEIDGLGDGVIRNPPELTASSSAASFQTLDVDTDKGGIVGQRVDSGLPGFDLKSLQPPQQEPPSLDLEGGHAEARRLRQRKLCPLGKLDLSSDNVLSNELDYALVELEGRYCHGYNIIPLYSGMNQVWLRVNFKCRIPQENVGIVTMTASSGILFGQLSATPAYIRLPGRHTLQEVYRVRLNRSVAQGDCGAAIVDRTTGNFYGYIVAGSAGSGSAYVMPAIPVLQDIERNFGAEVRQVRVYPDRHIHRPPRKDEDHSAVFKVVSFLLCLDFWWGAADTKNQQWHPVGQLNNGQFASRTYIKKLNEAMPPDMPSVTAAKAPRVSRRQRTGHAKEELEEIHQFQRQFFALPSEIKNQIMGCLPLPDMLSLRLISKLWNHLVTSPETPISMCYLQQQHIPSLATKLYPIPNPSDINLRYITGLWHRYSVASRLAVAIGEWISRDWIFVDLRDHFGNEALTKVASYRANFQPHKERMQRRIVPLLLIIFHFLERYRELFLDRLLRVENLSKASRSIEHQIIRGFTDERLLHVHQFFSVFVSFVERQFRPPSYYGRIEKQVRGYWAPPPPEEVLIALICLGGLRQVLKLVSIKKYESRRRALDEWFADVTQPVLRRQHFNLLFKPRQIEKHKGSGRETTGVRRDSGKGKGIETCTSLASGPPMGSLHPEVANLILENLPPFRNQIWLRTAEAILLERGVIDRVQDIKTNAQVVEELISPEISDIDEFLVPGIDGIPFQ